MAGMLLLGRMLDNVSPKFLGHSWLHECVTTRDRADGVKDPAPDGAPRPGLLPGLFYGLPAALDFADHLDIRGSTSGSSRTPALTTASSSEVRTRLASVTFLSRGAYGGVRFKS